MAVSPPAEPASIVSTAIMPIRKAPLPEAASVEPGLNPNQPRNRMKQPKNAIVMLWPGIEFDEPSLLYLPILGPRTIAPARPIQPPTACTTVEPAKSE